MSRPVEATFWRDPKTGRAHIGAKYIDKDGGTGPIAAVYRDGPWLQIGADPYDNHLMIHFAAVPLLIKELKRLVKTETKP